MKLFISRKELLKAITPEALITSNTIIAIIAFVAILAILIKPTCWAIVALAGM